jgi:hypothetical protein
MMTCDKTIRIVTDLIQLRQVTLSSEKVRLFFSNFTIIEIPHEKN